MRRYYVEVDNNVIKNPGNISGENIENIEITAHLKEVTEEFYIQYKDLLPATFELDAEGNMINIIPLPRPAPTEPEPSEIELLGQEVTILKLSNIQKDNTINVLGQELANIKLKLLQGGM